VFKGLIGRSRFSGNFLGDLAVVPAGERRLGLKLGCDHGQGYEDISLIASRYSTARVES
jgi:hypothetical protein